MIHYRSLFLSFIILIFSLFATSPVEVATKADMSNVEFGYPIKFLSKDLSGRDPPTFPRNVSIGTGSAHDLPTIYWGALIVNIIILVGFFEILLLIFNYLKKYFTYAK